MRREPDNTPAGPENYHAKTCGHGPPGRSAPLTLPAADLIVSFLACSTSSNPGFLPHFHYYPFNAQRPLPLRIRAHA